MKAIISIITPTYNRAHLLGRLWDSIRTQSIQEFEWIIIDDGSNDNTNKIIKKFGDSRIKYIYQENMGVNYARNRGELEITANYVIFIDSDDIFYSTSTIQEMLKEIQNTTKDIGVVSFTTITADSKKSLSHVLGEKIIANFSENYAKLSENLIYNNDLTKLYADQMEIDLFNRTSKTSMFNGKDKVKIIKKNGIN